MMCEMKIFFVTREELELLTDIRYFATLFCDLRPGFSEWLEENQDTQHHLCFGCCGNKNTSLVP